MDATVPVERIASKIYLIRGMKVMLDRDLAELYGVETRTLVQAVKRNMDRFPSDFMFQLSKNEFDSLRSQIVISKGKGGRRYPPYAFTEQGVATLEIEFYGGSTYLYYQVPQEVYLGLINAESHGKYFDQYVKKAGYSHTKVS